MNQLPSENKKETYVEKLLLKYKDKWYISKIVLKVLEDLKYFIAKLLILNFQSSRKKYFLDFTEDNNL